MKLTAIILAAGQGKRMRTELPKVLHRLGGKTLLEHVVQTAARLGGAVPCVIYGHQGARLRAALPELAVRWVEQVPQLGTGHAVQQALPGIPEDATVLILYGDVPLLRSATVTRLLAEVGDHRVALLVAELPNPAGYGRIVRDEHGAVRRIVEERDATPAERAIREVNTGILALPAASLRRWVGRLDNANAQGEYYLTDVIAMAVAEGHVVRTVQPETADEVQGVNDRVQLAALERSYQLRLAQRLMVDGVTLIDPARLDVRGELVVGTDVSIDVNVVFEGEVQLGDRVSIGPNNVLRNVRIANDVAILPNCVLEDATIGAGCQVGPYARVRPGTELAEHVHVGNFVEIKRSTVAEGSKINQLSYVGDATVGRDVIVGAGTITCNYDGAHKHPTVICDGVFIGSGTQLVAPVRIGAGATIGAGSTITRDVPADKLTLSGRNPQVTLDSWVRPRKRDR